MAKSTARTYDNTTWDEKRLIDKAYERVNPAPAKPVFTPPKLPTVGNVRAKGFKRIAVDIEADRRQELPTITLTAFNSTSAEQITLDIEAAQELVANLQAMITAALAHKGASLEHESAMTAHEAAFAAYERQKRADLNRALPSIPEGIDDPDDYTSRLSAILNLKPFAPAVAPSAGEPSSVDSVVMVFTPSAGAEAHPS
jgi:hypothetical protein